MLGVTSSPDASVGPKPRPRTGVVLATLLTCQLMIMVDVTVMNVALPGIGSDLDVGATGLTWVTHGYTLAFGGLLLLGGRAGDLWGRRRMFLTGVALFTAASAVGGLAPSAAWLVGARVVQGVGAAVAGPNALALLTTVFTEPRARMRALALYSGMAGAGFAVGLLVGGVLTQGLGWRAVLFINVPLGGLALLAAVRCLPAVPRRPGRLDLPGALTATAGVTALVYGFNRAATHGWGDAAACLALGAGAVSAVAFVAVERGAAQPLLPLSLFADRDRAAAYANVFVGYMASIPMFFFLSLYVQEVRGLGALATGFAFLPTAALMFALIQWVPRLLRRFGPGPITLTGSVSMVAALVLLTRLTTGTPYVPLVLAAALLMGCGTGLALMPLSVVIMSRVPQDVAGVAGGALQTIQQTGAALGLSVLTTVFGAASRGAAGPPRQVLVTGVTAAFTAAAVMAALTIPGTLAFRRRRRDEP
ncbi:MFS transporter [Streptomyces longispororuber]|uniref:MFS transporter n=1 Tax=Streptomyces longispororuber TaxID=68230 RepID=UPI001E35A5CE|nr:MFS transporter [Streptomyces longispororuber]